MMTENFIDNKSFPGSQLGAGFCKTAGLYVRYYRNFGVRGFGHMPEVESWQSPEETDFLSSNFPQEEDQALLQSFLDDTPENIIKQGAKEGLLKYGVGFRNGSGELIGVTIFLGITTDYPDTPAYIMTTEEEHLLESLKFFISVMDAMMESIDENDRIQDTLTDVINESDRNSALLREKSALTEILESLELEDEFVTIASRVLKTSSDELRVTEGALIGLSENKEKINVISKYTPDTLGDMLVKLQGEMVEDVPFFNGKPFTISSDTALPDRFKVFFEKYGIRAGVFLPLKIREEAEMYLLFISNENRQFSQSDIKFMINVQHVLQAILTRRITTNSLTGSYVTLEAILENSGCGMEVIDVEKNEVLYANDTFRKMTEYVNDREQLQALLMSRDTESVARPKFHATGAERWYDITFSTIKWVDGRNARLCTIYDTTVIREYQIKVEHQANTDYLTGLKNRKRCELDLASEIRKASRTGQNGAFIYLDLDNFRNINDSIGHEFGDKLLKQVAEELLRITRMNGSVYRIGGDEFVIVINSEADRDLDNILHKMHDRFSKAWRVDDKECYCTASIGVTFYPVQGDTAVSLFGRGDIALRDAKKAGKNKISYYKDCQYESTERRILMEKCMRKAVENDCAEFEIYYQPLVDVTKKQNTCCGAEALLRWNSTELGMIMPSEFISVAEHLGLIVDIGRHVINEAVTTCKHWNDFGHPEYQVNVNLSVPQILQGDIVDTVKKALISSGLEPKNLTLEVTESLAIYDLNNMTDALKSLRDLGVRVALDDFGTGYSSLNHLRFLPLDVIKIDRCFAGELGEDQFSEAFIKTVSRLAEAMNANVVVEGVERIEQADALSNMNIDMIQGYLYDKPLPRDVFEKKYL